MCGCECCQSSNPTCFDPSKVDTWGSYKAWACDCTCPNCVSRVIQGAFDEGSKANAKRHEISTMLSDSDASDKDTLAYHREKLRAEMDRQVGMTKNNRWTLRLEAEEEK